MKKPHFLLIIIVMVGLALRLYQVSSLPSILNRDEAALAYNAFLLKETGMDEWGRSWPLALESFGDYKLLGYPLLSVVSFSIFGYSDLAVRLPSVIAGTAIIVIAYWWGRCLYLSPKLSLVSAVITSVIPIFWFYSRMAFEANVGLALILVVIGLLWWPPRKQRVITDVISILIALAAVFTYNTPLLLLPVILIAIPFQRGISLWRNWIVPVAGLLLAGVVAGWVLLPLSAQKSGITIFSDATVNEAATAYREQFSGLAQRTFGHKVVYLSGVMLRNFGTSFSPSFLVTTGGSHPWHQLPSWGHLYWSVYVLGILGIGVTAVKAFQAVRRRRFRELGDRTVWVVLLLFSSLLPSIVTVDAPHATRSLVFFFILILLSVVGLSWLSALKRIRKHEFMILPVFLVILFIEAARYGQLYFIQYPSQQGAFQPGYEQQLQLLSRLYPQEKVAVVDGGGYQYILTAWYLKLPPSLFFETVVKQLPDKIGFRYGEKVERFHFVAKPGDQQPDEKILLEWSNSEMRWKLKS